jgi:hypothetical protein
MTEMAPEIVLSAEDIAADNGSEPAFPERSFTTSVEILGFASANHVEVGTDGKIYYDC